MFLFIKSHIRSTSFAQFKPSILDTLRRTSTLFLPLLRSISATMARYSLAFSLLTLFSLANTASIPAPYSLLSRDGGDVAVGDKWKKHNAIASFLQKSDAEHQLRFSPSIYSKAGCVPYPAVDNEGYHG